MPAAFKSIRNVAVVAFAVLFVAVQVFIPLRALVKRGGFYPFDLRRPGKTHHFSWQMYSKVNFRSRLIAVYEGGKRQNVKAQAVFGPLLSQVQYGRFLPQLVCSKDPRIVRVVRKRGRRTETFKC
jgi:hypothetical protein